MSEAAVGSVQDELALVRAGRENVTLLDIFIEFLIIGATSFGGVVPTFAITWSPRNTGLTTRNLSSSFQSARPCPD